ncbi:MAG: FAD-binding oxidoreductase [Verrucomicrobia bacterium]|nr:FAD-binding oxidoreductase [Verrucomicrobiota bacterium]
MTSTHISDLAAILGREDAVLVDPQMVERLSKDFYWYSPVLKILLEDKRAEAVVQPRSREEIQNVLRYCFDKGIPVTTRGSGTGNYGQAVPLDGGVVIDLAPMDRILTIEPSGVAVCEPGARLIAIENEARKVGWELRCYPSTYVKASIGGFLGGGSGGIGSITYGGLRDNQTVQGIELLTMEKEPRFIRFEGEEVHQILHSWGTNGIITEVRLALGPKRDWAQLVVAFASYDTAYTFAEKIANDAPTSKRLVTVFEWPIPSYFTPIQRFCPTRQSLVFFLVDDPALPDVVRRADLAGGTVAFSQPHTEPRKGPLLTDYTWNHTTLWALKTAPDLTYLQCGFNPDSARQQFRLLRERFGTDFLFHIEFVKNDRDRIIPAGLPIVRFKDEDYLNDMIDYCREIGVSVANPHVNQVEGGGRFRSDNIQLQAKYRYDPRGLLNPGKMATFSPEDTTAAQK